MDDHLPDRPASGNRRFAIAVNKGMLGFARHWAAFLSLIVLIYAGLPFVAPVAMHYGATGLGQAIYTIYKPMCHQFAFRSWFLFGDAAAYPRARAGLSGPTFEEYAAQEPFFRNIADLSTLDNSVNLAARAFTGSERMGYKVALCERDVAIYAMLALFGFAFFVIQKFHVRVPYLPMWAYFLIGIVPIGLDGFSQLFANPPFYGFGIPFYPIRESTPLLRTLTGALFGLANGWLAYPYIEESMADTAEIIETKLIRAGIIESPAESGAD